jgi:ribose transport system substrate-binding protein
MGNSWRANLAAELELLTKQLADQGLAEPEVNITNSNGDINLELTQLKAQVAQGCDLIMSYPGSATGLCAGIREAAQNGALFVAIDSPVTCPEAINVATNPYYRGKFEGEWIAEKLGGKGNVIVMNGQPGTANTVAQQQGFEDAVAKSPDVAILGALYGMWTPSVAKAEMLKFLATHPRPVDAVFSTGNMGVGVGQALEQSGRPVSIITEVTNLCSLLAYWKEKNLTANTFVQDGGPMLYASFVPALYAMAGRKPRVNTLYMPLPTITNENFDDYYDASMTVESTCFANGKDLHLVPDSYWEQFFTGDQKVPEVQIVPTP